jgi:hypothetical protein
VPKGKVKTFTYKTCGNTAKNCHNLIRGRANVRFCSPSCGLANRTGSNHEYASCFLCADSYMKKSKAVWYCPDCKPFVQARTRAARTIAMHRNPKNLRQEITVIIWELYQRRNDEYCQICGRTFEEGPRGKHVKHIDHSHKTGRIRSSLCGSCNVMLGYANDNWAVLSSAIAYLQQQHDLDSRYAEQSAAPVPISGGGSRSR